ncbi:MAG: alpha/beta hydrolase family protein [Rickettsiaceae bacterium]|jgi:hypothetical protein|nr:alpha/beta hydrolase family protein [Rickettsiaceae bacterium]
MKTIEFVLMDKKRSREVPVCIYMPISSTLLSQAVIFGPGYQGQEELANENIKPVYKNYEFLAEYFTNKNYAFISIQHDILGDNDGLKTIDPLAVQHEARKHLYVRGENNINFVIRELKQQFPNFNIDKFIISGHSNGGDIAKFYACNYPNKVSHVITFDARRCRIEPNKNLKILMFEATDTSTDKGVLPDEGSQDNPKRNNLEWVIVKPKTALHVSYMDDYITPVIKAKVYKTLDWFLG